MLRHARMAAIRKLHRSVVWSGQSPVGAVSGVNSRTWKVKIGTRIRQLSPKVSPNRINTLGARKAIASILLILNAFSGARGLHQPLDFACSYLSVPEIIPLFIWDNMS